MIKKIYLLLLFIITTIFTLKAQTSGVTNPQMNTVTIPTPNAASLGKFGDYPVSLYSGLVNISIPVYEIKSGSLSLPVALRYHPSGNKVADVSNWIGLGWSLDAGGMITRKVNGNVDETSNGYLSVGNVVKGTVNFRTSQDDLNYLLNFQRGFIDGEPDVFSYNLAGRSGHFIFNRDKTTLIKLPLDKTQITANLAANTITIVDENGITYQFGKGLDSSSCYETSNSFDPFKQTSVPVVTSWLLSAMISPDKADTISFKYTSQYLQGLTDINDYCVLKDQKLAYSPPTTFQSSTVASCYTYNVSNYSVEYKISEIGFRNGKILFNPSTDNRLDRTNDKKLSSITVYKYDYSTSSYLPLKTIQLYQSYYSNNDRLRLDSLKYTDNQNAGVEAYSFGYNSTILPSNLSRQKDWWGYYNSNYGSTLVPATQVSFINDGGTASTVTVGDANREPDTSRMKACVLERINYPTRGHTEFTYETNKYYYSNSIINAGGLRIKQIRKYDGISATPFILTYKYGNNESGYGNLNAPSNFSINPSFFSSSIISQAWGGPQSQQVCPESIRSRTYSSSLSIGLVPYDGVPVYYDYVTEYDGDPATGTVSGKTIYNYLFTPDVNNSYVPNSMAKLYTQTNYWQRGYLASKSIYDSNNKLIYQLSNNYGSFQSVRYDSVGLLVSRNYDYVTSPPASESLNDPNVTGASFNCGHPIYLFDYASYPVTTGNYVLNSTTETTFDQNTPSSSLVKTTSYVYNNNNYQPLQMTTNLSSGENEVTNIKYPLDYTVSSLPDSKSSGILNLQSKNIITVPVEKYTQRMNANGTNPRTITGILTSFKTSQPYPDTIYRFESSTGVSDFSASTITGNSFIKDYRYQPAVIMQSFDSRGNTLQQQKISDPIRSYVWDYNQQYPVAEVVNASLQDIAYTSFEANGTGNWTITGAATVQDATSPTGNKYYTLSAANYLTKSGLNTGSVYVVSYWSKNGSSSYLVNGAAGTAGMNANGWVYYEHVVSGVSAITISGSGSIDEVRLYPKGSLMTTYAFNPLVGMTNKCDALNHIVYYEYDAFSRLKLIRDSYKNVVKRFDYLYQIPNNASAYWVTINGPACELNSSGSNTGNQLTTQKNINPNSSTYTQTQTISTYNTTACPVMANVTYSNATSDYIYLKLTNTSTNTTYSFTLNSGAASGTVAGQVPIGTYNVNMSASNASALYTYSFYTFTSAGVNSTSFYNVQVCATCAVARITY